MAKFIALLIFISFQNLVVSGQANYHVPYEGYFSLRNFIFETGEKLDSLKLHYYTLGKPVKGSDGKVKNAVLVLHGTNANAKGFLGEQFGGFLFGPGQLLDVSKYFIIIPDCIGHGKSSRPSEGLHMKFPQYDYNDMVKSEYQLLTEHLGVNHLRLILGTSMGAMHCWIWGYTYADFMDALLPLASQPVPITGRNRMMRKLAIDLIKMDPEWKGGEYKAQPKLGLSGAISSFFFMNSSSLRLQKSAPTRDAADALAEKTRDANLASLDANDVIYALEASRNYDPSPYLQKIKVPLFAINSADDEINPPELKTVDVGIKNVPKGRYILLPVTEQTAGHGTNSMPSVWGNYLKELLDVSKNEVNQ